MPLSICHAWRWRGGDVGSYLISEHSILPGGYRYHRGVLCCLSPTGTCTCCSPVTTWCPLRAGCLTPRLTLSPSSTWATSPSPAASPPSDRPTGSPPPGSATFLLAWPIALKLPHPTPDKLPQELFNLRLNCRHEPEEMERPLPRGKDSPSGSPPLLLLLLCPYLYISL